MNSSAATPPATARRKKPAATAAMSKIAHVLEHARVGGGQRDVGDDDEQQAEAGEQRDRAAPATSAATAAAVARARADLARGDRAVALDRVGAVGLAVGDVVEQVGAGRGEAERDERDARVGEDVAGGELARGGGDGEDEQVLDPLARARRHQQRASAGPRRGRTGSSLRVAASTREVFPIARA